MVEANFLDLVLFGAKGIETAYLHIQSSGHYVVLWLGLR